MTPLCIPKPCPRPVLPPSLSQKELVPNTAICSLAVKGLHVKGWGSPWLSDGQLRVVASCAHHSHYHPGGNPDLRRWAELSDGSFESQLQRQVTRHLPNQENMVLRSFSQNFRSSFLSLRSCLPSEARSSCFSCQEGISFLVETEVSLKHTLAMCQAVGP